MRPMQRLSTALARPSPEKQLGVVAQGRAKKEHTIGVLLFGAASAVGHRNTGHGPFELQKRSLTIIY